MMANFLSIVYARTKSRKPLQQTAFSVAKNPRNVKPAHPGWEQNMIEDPPILTVRSVFERPDSEQLARLSQYSTGNIADALGGRAALAPEIKPIDEGAGRFCGIAIPCHTGPADNLAVFAALELSCAGDVIVIAADQFCRTAVVGDLVLGMAKNRGIAAIVTDGCVRDVEGIRDLGLPCFAAGVIPDSPARNGPGTAGLDISIGGRVVSAGDVIVGDLDGVVVVPSTKIDEVLKNLIGIEEAEKELEEEVKNGLELPGFVTELLTSDAVKKVD